MREDFRGTLKVSNRTVSVTEVSPGDGARHEFHVTLRERDVRLTDGKPFPHWPSPDDIARLLAEYTPDPPEGIAALVAALRHVCRELRVIESESDHYRVWARSLRESLDAELPTT